MSKTVLTVKEENFSTRDAALLEDVLSKKFGYISVESKPTRVNDDIWEFTAEGREPVVAKTRKSKEE